MSTRDLQAIGASDERSSTRARCYLQLNLETDLIRLRRLLPQRQSRPCRDRSISSIRRACGKGARSLLCGWLQAHCGGRREPLQPHCGGRGQNPCGRTAEAGEKPLQSHCGRTAGGSCPAGERLLPGRGATPAGQLRAGRAAAAGSQGAQCGDACGSGTWWTHATWWLDPSYTHSDSHSSLTARGGVAG